MDVKCRPHDRQVLYGVRRRSFRSTRQSRITGFIRDLDAPIPMQKPIVTKQFDRMLCTT